MTNDLMRPIGFFELVDLFGAEFDVDCIENLLEVMSLGGADNRHGHAGRLQNPCASNLGGCYPVFFCNFLSDRRDLKIVVIEIHFLLHLISLCTLGWTFSTFAFAITLEKTTCERTPRYQSNTLIQAEGDH